MEVEKYTMIYKLEKDMKELRILNEKFVESNINKGFLILKNQRYYLDSLIEIHKRENEEIKIIMILNKNVYNKSYMFKDCKYLLSLSIESDLDIKDNIKRINILDGQNWLLKKK